MHDNTSIPEKDRIPFFQKISFATGTNFEYLAVNLTTGVLWMPFFNIGLGMSPVKLGIVLMLVRAWDMLSDPIIGNLSDNTRTRWGRRRPYMAVSAFILAAIYPFIWRPDTSWGETGMLVYLVVLGLILFLSTTCFSMPYYAMQLELTPNYDERTRLTAWCAFFGKIMHLSGGWAMAILTCSYFANPETGEPDIVRGMHYCSWFIAGMILVFGLVPALFVRERYYAAESSKQAKESLWKSMKESSQCKPLWILIGITFFLVFGTYSVASLGQYVNFYYIKGGELAEASIIEGWKSTVTAVVGVLSLPFWTWVSHRLDKTKTLMLLLGLAVVGQLLKIVCLDPRWPYLQLIPAVLISGVIGAVWLLLPSMKADTADYDELHTTRRREGSINAFYSFFFKLAVTLAMLASGLLLELTGFDVAQPAQSTEVVLRMKYVYIIVPTAIWAMSLVCVLFYRLNRGRMKEIRAQLESRRGAL